MTDNMNTADLVKRLRECSSDEAMWSRQAADRIEHLEAALTRTNAATAAAYEVAAKALDAVADQWSCGHPAMHCDCARDVEQWRFASDEIRALATPDQTAALDKLIGEAVKPYVALLDRADQALMDSVPDYLFEGRDPEKVVEDIRTIIAASKKGGV